MLTRLTRWKQLAPLLVLVLLMSAGLSTTTLLLRGSSAALLSSKGVGTNIVIISGGGRVPETGAVSLKQVQNVTALPGVLTASPEVFAPAYSLGHVVVVRGVNLSEFPIPRLVSSSGPPPPSPGYKVYFGKSLANSLSLTLDSIGSSITLQGLLSNATKTVLVAGIITVGPPYDNEILAPIGVAQALRGFSADQVTFLRLGVDPAVLNTDQLLRTLRGSASGASKGQPNAFLQQVQLAPTTSIISITPSGGPSSPSLATALERGLGLAQSAFESLAVVILVASVLAVYFATSSWIYSVRSTAETISSLGLDRRRVLLWLLAAAVPGTILAGTIGYGIGYAAVAGLTQAGDLSFFFRPLTVAFDPATLVVSSVGPAFAVALSVTLNLSRNRLAGAESYQ